MTPPGLVAVRLTLTLPDLQVLDLWYRYDWSPVWGRLHVGDFLEAKVPREIGDMFRWHGHLAHLAGRRMTFVMPMRVGAYLYVRECRVLPLEPGLIGAQVRRVGEYPWPAV